MARHNEDGAEAEKRVAQYLHDSGYKILSNNWKTSWCEIDVVAEKDNCVHFVEVKYRSNSNQGSGLDYITPQKLRKMELAAKSWVEINSWKGDYVLSAAEVSGVDFDLEFINQI